MQWIQISNLDSSIYSFPKSGLRVIKNYTVNGIKSLICFSMKMTAQTQITICKALKIKSVYLRELGAASANSAQRSVVKISNLNAAIYPVLIITVIGANSGRLDGKFTLQAEKSPFLYIPDLQRMNI